jgi:hypothetical protein
MSKIIIQDNILTKSANHAIHRHFFANQEQQLSSWVDKENLPDLFKLLIDDASKYFDLSTAVGYEWWTHKDGTRPPFNWHCDFDEKLFNDEGSFKFPLCSIIYYPTISNLQGGNFLTEDTVIEPKTNRAIYMAPGVLHNVDVINSGTRMSLLINVWTYKLDYCLPTFYIKN